MVKLEKPDIVFVRKVATALYENSRSLSLKGIAEIDSKLRPGLVRQYVERCPKLFQLTPVNSKKPSDDDKVWLLDSPEVKELLQPENVQMQEDAPTADTSLFGDLICDYFTNEHGMPYVTIKNGEHQEHWPVRSREISDFVVKAYYEKDGKPPSRDVLNKTLDLFSAKAKFGGHRLTTYLRCAMVDNVLYVDLCRPSWEVVKVTKDDISIISNPPIVFRRYGHMKTLNVDLGANINDINLIMKYVPNLVDGQQRLFKTSFVSDFLPDIPRPISLVYGPQGSAKTTSQKIERSAVDPSALLTLNISSNLGELTQQAYHHYICIYDNVSRLPKVISDWICRVVTGEGYSKRELYTDEGDIIFTALRKVFLNGINLAGTEPDFLDRAIKYQLSRLSKEQRKTEKELWDSFAVDQPRITGAALKILQKAMGIMESLKVKELPRMADFALWGEAISQGMGDVPGIFLYDYWGNIGELNKDALEANAIGLCVLEFVKDNPLWEGSPSELLEELNTTADRLRINVKEREWPKNPTWLTRRLNDIKVNLQDEGIKFESTRVGTVRGLKFSVNSVIACADSDSLPSQKNNLVSLLSQKNDTNDGKVTVKNRIVSHKTHIDSNENDTNDGILPKSFSGDKIGDSELVEMHKKLPKPKQVRK